MAISIYIARHASPDWDRKDIPYDVPPGPPLTAVGEAEARALGNYLLPLGIRAIFTSPLERALRTACLAGESIGIAPIVEHAVAEWRRDETADIVGERLLPFWERIAAKSERHGPVCIVTHGGPIGLLLDRLGLARDELDGFRARFDNRNPAPPAGVWRARSRGFDGPWHLELMFMPGANPSD